MIDLALTLITAQALAAAVLWALAHLALRSVETGSTQDRLTLATWTFYGAALLPLAALLPRQLVVSLGASEAALFTWAAPSLSVALPFGAAILGAIASVALLRAALTYGRLLQNERLVSRAEDLAPARFGLPPSVRIAVSDDVYGPLLASLMQPTILLPRAMLNLPLTELAPILRHECAHVGRHDVRNALVQRLILDLFWWSPAMHALGKLLTEQREMVCDAYAAEDGDAYIQTLLKEARRRCPPALVGAQMSGARLERRVLRLAAHHFHTVAPFMVALALLLTTSALLTPRAGTAGETRVTIASS
ncbi:regulatory sensor-transducer of BlaR1/MecR1 family [alpha proteobacterium U9-1i]|nr:regulatory sensor-transducer of BlaR1/MecR1 family [alpha proteobacterium U9-1i]